MMSQVSDYTAVLVTLGVYILYCVQFFTVCTVMSSLYFNKNIFVTLYDSLLFIFNKSKSIYTKCVYNYFNPAVILIL